MKKILTILLLSIVFAIILNVFGIIGNEGERNNSDSQSTRAPEIVNKDKEIDSKGYLPIEVDNETGFKTSWFSFLTDGDIEIRPSYNTQSIKVNYPGTNLNSSQLYRDGIPLINGNFYNITAVIESEIKREIEVVVDDADSGVIYFSQEISLDGETNIDLQFQMVKDSITNGRLLFNIGNDNSKDILKEHDIVFSNIRFHNTSSCDDSIRVNHLGYTLNNDKKATFPYNQGDFFDVINVENGEIVYTGAIVNEVVNEKTGETNYFGNFSNVLQPGKYRIEAQIVGKSYDFEISANPYQNIANDLLKFFSYQRCAYTLDPSWSFDLSHVACHDTAAIVYDDQTRVIDVNGGWHDAGDYGRYVETGTKSAIDLMLAYYSNPSFFGDNSLMPESGNEVPDILDEARFEIEWLMKMQADWGGVYSKAVTQTFAGNISPDKDMQRIYVMPAETATTADFISTMAIASVVYKEIDPVFAQSCLDKTFKSWDNLTNTLELVEFTNPQDFSAGDYRDDKDFDERFFAGIAMWFATGDEQYLDYAKSIYSTEKTASNGTSWRDVGGYGSYLFLRSKEANEHGDFYESIKQDFKNESDRIMSIIDTDGYQTSLENYPWGSNGYIANNGIMLMFAYDIFNDMSYKQGAVEQLNYILGKNSLNMSFVSGYGNNAPKNIHHRLVKAKKTFMKGALVGGPDNDREDGITQKMNPNTPPAKVYCDEYLSFSSNEVTIYWNSALIYLISRIN